MPKHRNRRAVARLSIEYVACVLSEGMADTGLDILDYAIVLVVAASNIGHLKCEAVGASGDSWAAAAIPADLMAPVSFQGVAESLKLPLHVARERVEGLVERGVLQRAGAGAVIVGEPVTSSDVAAQLADKNVAMARRFVRQLADVGVNA